MRKETGDALAASAAIEEWRSQLGAVGGADQLWAGLRKALETLSAMPLLRSDRIARDMLREMAWADDMEDVQAVLARLDERIAVLLTRRQRNGAGADTAERPRRTRTLIRL